MTSAADYLAFGDLAMGHLEQFVRLRAGLIPGTDRFGRKFSLVATVVLIGVACTSIGCLPTYDQIGIAAPILLVLCRLLQGFSAGGEIGSAASYIREPAGGDSFLQ